mmetsp:Transcript_16019/g.18110  ORF Transcript_16019/g.18110 Transcript_16019/m.18110 type:complete len:526 (+) Transcript_16019:294-1871(+)
MRHKEVRTMSNYGYGSGEIPTHPYYDSAYQESQQNFFSHCPIEGQSTELLDLLSESDGELQKRISTDQFGFDETHIPGHIKQESVPFDETPSVHRNLDSDGEVQSKQGKGPTRGGKGKAPAGGSLSGPLQEMDKEAKKKYIAAASRKTRAKRKMEREQMTLRTLELEEEQGEFMKTIAHLQNQIQALKRCRSSFGHIDLETENKLLRAEVKRHRAFVNQISTIRTSLPKYTREEKLRLARTGIDSAAGQGLGLAYSSVISNSWTRISIPVPEDLSHILNPDTRIEISYQYLPHGSTRQNAKRVNVRTDYFYIDGSPESLSEMVWRCYNNPNFSMSEVYSDNVKDTYEEMHGFFDDTEGSSIGASSDTFWDENQYRIKLWRYAESDDSDQANKIDSVGVVAMHSEVLSSDGFPTNPRSFHQLGNFKEDTESENIPGHVVSFSFVSENDHIFGEVADGFRRNRTSFYDTFFSLDSDIEGKSHLTQVTSMPIEVGGFEFFSPEMCYPVDDAGEVSKFFLWYIRTVCAG